MIFYKQIPTLTKEDLEHFWSLVNKRGPKDCWFWLGSVDGKGYGKFNFNGSRYRAHRISYAIEYGDPGEINVNHFHDNPSCVNPAHLWLGTQAEGMADKVVKDRQTKGEQDGNAKLTEGQVKEILESDENQQVLACKYNISQSVISTIKNGKAWKHIEGIRHTNKARSNSKTGVRGVTLHYGKYVALVRFQNKKYYLGRFDTIVEAEAALNIKRHELGIL